MIKALRISDYALISRSAVDVSSGFTVITGETGAGKSVLLGALGLLLGDRADSSVVREGCPKCVVEMDFNMEGYGLELWFEENGLDYDTLSVIRREVTADGRSRCFINDTPVSVKMLKEFGSFIIDLHSQHQSLLLGKRDFQMEMLDAFASTGELLLRYQEVYGRFRSLNREISRLEQEAEEAEKERGYLAFRFSSLEEAGLSAGECARLEEELKVKENSAAIKSAFAGMTERLRDSEDSVVAVLNGLLAVMRPLSGVIPEADEMMRRLDSARIDLADLADETDRRAESVEYDGSGVEAIKERLGVIYDLQLKFKADSDDRLVEIREELREKLDAMEQSKDGIAGLKKELAQVEGELEALADRLHERRSEGGKRLGTELERLLGGLGIKHPVFRVEVEPAGEFLASGRDRVRFLFAANMNQTPDEISKMASGGEVSRVMLAFKYVLSASKKLPVIIFDEIDTGVSGDIAHRMADMMKEMSGRMQVVSVSHLPQIAAAADHHFKVYKEDDAGSTVSRIRELTRDERVMELAVMMSGSSVTPEAVKAAERLLL